jgi:hypothetical protein
VKEEGVRLAGEAATLAGGARRSMAKQYAAKILWQFRVQRGGVSKKRRVCEERTVIFRSTNAETAFRKALAFGREQELSWHVEEQEGVDVFCELVGVVDLLELSDWDEREDCQEVWWELRERVEPLERKQTLIPNKKDLRALDRSPPRRHKGRAVLRW